MNKTVCFSDNRTDVEVAFRDYMNHYVSDNGGKGSLPYDKSVSFAEKEKKVNSVMLQEVRKLSGVAIDGASGVTKEMASQNPMVQWAAFAVVNSLIDIVVPDLLEPSIGAYTESRYGAFGDSFNFIVEPNDLFLVSKAGRDQRTVEFQKQFAGQVTVVPENREVTVSVNFYKVLCNIESLAKFTMKAVLSLETQITKEVYAAFDAAMSALPTTPVDGKLNVTGWNEKDVVRLGQTVAAYNGSDNVIMLGIKVALSDILPSDANYRYTFDSDYVKVGYINDFKGMSVLEMRQIADYRNKYKLALKDDRIYILSAGTDKPIKLCYEGSSFTATLPSQQHADLSETSTINKSYGIAVATNKIAGIVTL